MTKPKEWNAAANGGASENHSSHGRNLIQQEDGKSYADTLSGKRHVLAGGQKADAILSRLSSNCSSPSLLLDLPPSMSQILSQRKANPCTTLTEKFSDVGAGMISAPHCSSKEEIKSQQSSSTFVASQSAKRIRVSNANYVAFDVAIFL